MQVLYPFNPKKKKKKKKEEEEEEEEENHISKNKFAKTTINTYNKKNPILTLKHTYGNFRVSAHFNFTKTKFMWSSSMTFTTYKIIMLLYQKEKTFSNTKESETMKEHKKQASRSKQNNLCFLD